MQNIWHISGVTIMRYAQSQNTGNTNNLIILWNFVLTSFFLYVDVFFHLFPTRLLSDLTVYIWITWWVSDKKQELLILRQYLFTSGLFWWDSVFFVLLVFVLCLVCAILTVFLDSPFLVALFGFLERLFFNYLKRLQMFSIKHVL